MGNLLCKQALKTHNQPDHFIQCKHASKRDSSGCGGMHHCCFAFVLMLQKKNDERLHSRRNWRLLRCSSSLSFVCVLKSSESLLLKNVFIKAHLHVFEQVSVSVCARRHVRAWHRRACIALKGIRRPHFQFCSISAGISVIPLKSSGSPTVTSHNGANTRVVGTQLRLPGSIRCTFPIPQPVCMQTEPPPPPTPRSPSTENTDLAACHWALCRHI